MGQLVDVRTLKEAKETNRQAKLLIQYKRETGADLEEINDIADKWVRKLWEALGQGPLTYKEAKAYLPEGSATRYLRPLVDAQAIYLCEPHQVQENAFSLAPHFFTSQGAISNSLNPTF